MSFVLRGEAIVLQRQWATGGIRWVSSSACGRSMARPRRVLAAQLEIRSLTTAAVNNACLSWHYITSGKRRCFSSSSKSSNTKLNLQALPFIVSPSQALDKFDEWAQKEQGLSYFLRSTSLTAAYCPVWSFDVNLRFVVTDKASGQKRLDWKPGLFGVYGRQSVVHIPGLATYAGYNYPRSLVNPVHNTTLVFLNDKMVPFGPWMLKDIQRDYDYDDDDGVIPITPDPWNATRGRALHVLKQELVGISQGEHDDESGVVDVQMEVLRHRRVYMPTYVIEYSLWGGVTYQAFVSGADEGAGVSGPSHQLWETSNERAAARGLQGFLSQAVQVVQQSTRTLGGQRTLALLAVGLRFLGQLLGPLLVRIPWIAALLGGLVGFRKFIQPFLGSRWTSAEWERQREHEASGEEQQQPHEDDFMDSGSAQRFFHANRERILRHFTGDDPENQRHESGDDGFYSEWEEWARRAYNQQQQQENYSQQQQSGRQSASSKRPEYQWDFNPDDPYSVLGIARGATKAQVSAAFRREMLKYHPDAQSADTSEATRLRNTERSKLISQAYRKIKAEMK